MGWVSVTDSGSMLERRDLCVVFDMFCWIGR